MKYLFALFVMLLCSFSFGQAAGGATDPSIVSFEWIPPTAREDGTALTAGELGGYEIKYKKKADLNWKNVVIPSASAKGYTISGLTPADYEFQIAAFDVNGLYSRFVSINYKVVVSAPKAPTGFVVKKNIIDVVATCIAATPNCRVAVQGEWQ